MSVQVLITTMNLENPVLLLDRLNVDSSFVIGNQANNNSIQVIHYHGHKGIVITRNEKGVGNNRNITLKYADSDICILSDDDMKFIDNYPEIVKKTFERLPDADAIIFNLGNAGKKRRKNLTTKKLNKYNFMNYGAARMAFKRQSVSYQGICFNINFGGGTRHSAGEDSLFIGECIKKGLNIYAVPETIAYLLDNRESTWFKGYNDKYLFDKGVFLSIADSRMAKIMAMYLAIKHPEYKNEKMTTLQVYKEICRGINYIKRKEYLHNESNNKD